MRPCRFTVHQRRNRAERSRAAALPRAKPTLPGNPPPRGETHAACPTPHRGHGESPLRREGGKASTAWAQPSSYSSLPNTRSVRAPLSSALVPTTASTSRVRLRLTTTLLLHVLPQPRLTLEGRNQPIFKSRSDSYSSTAGVWGLLPQK